ncbi:hypothetical protein CPB83DRAFT_850334 [Crepidotus variabilis]|uniref:Uncharacterized protein n=1 Tax=Crepidotus variabilis TaxID=179855 RepID=A0A9P6EKH4_9AGAR|nr:hypothetical protein CPB83DRAFT_850334 [Crepidotus variabilis]
MTFCKTTMSMSFGSLVWVVLLISTLASWHSVLAKALPPSIKFLDREIHYQNIQKRNLSTFLNNIPSGCSTQCEVVVGAAHTCQYLPCVCTNDNAENLLTCVNCAVALTPYVDGIVDQYQAILDEWSNSYCAMFGTPPLKVTSPLTSSKTSPLPPSSPSPTANTASLRFVPKTLFLILFALVSFSFLSAT